MRVMKAKTFQDDHKKLLPGIHVLKKTLSDNLVITTFELRFKKPNEDIPISSGALHTIEHLGNFYLGTLSPLKDEIIYFGPMGSRTGFRLIMKGSLRSQDVYEMVTKMCDFVIMHSGEIPRATEHECGNCLDHDLAGAKLCAIEYSDWLRNNPHYEYQT